MHEFSASWPWFVRLATQVAENQVRRRKPPSCPNCFRMSPPLALFDRLRLSYCCSAMSPSYWFLLLTRALVGFGLGGASVIFSLFMEFTPASRRGFWLVFVEFFWTVRPLPPSSQMDSVRSVHLSGAEPSFTPRLGSYCFITGTLRPISLV